MLSPNLVRRKKSVSRVTNNFSSKAKRLGTVFRKNEISNLSFTSAGKRNRRKRTSSISFVNQIDMVGSHPNYQSEANTSRQIRGSKTSTLVSEKVQVKEIDVPSLEQTDRNTLSMNTRLSAERVINLCYANKDRAAFRSIPGYSSFKMDVSIKKEDLLSHVHAQVRENFNLLP
jgi:hypothetical protein